MTGYKIVNRVNSKAFGPATKMALQRIRYRLGQTTKQVPTEHGPFACFNTLENVYASTIAGDMILEVDYVPAYSDVLWKKAKPHFSRGYSHYYARSAGVIERTLDECPIGTVLASEVTPTRVVR